MKKLICMLLVAISVFSLAACSKDPVEETPTKAPTVHNWPDNALFKDVPAIGGTINFYNEEKAEEGYVYTFFADGIDYKGLKDYVKQLEAAGFSVYDSTGLNITKTEDMLPDELDEGTYSAKWIGKRRGLYVAINWYADEYYETNNLPKDSNVRLYFYTYNAFKTN